MSQCDISPAPPADKPTAGTALTLATRLAILSAGSLSQASARITTDARYVARIQEGVKR